MKAIVTTRYGPPEVLQLREVPNPTPADDELLIKVYASSVNPLDSFGMRGPLFFVPAVGKLLKPKRQVLGADLAGRVESVGSSVKQFRPGDEVFGVASSRNGLGGFAEYACAKESDLALKPANLSFDEAAAVPVAAITALQALRDQGHVRRGQRVLIDGAGGGVGTFAVQIAKAFEAEVTAVCSAGNIAAASAMGADHVIDYNRDDYSRGGQSYDLILGVNGRRSVFDSMRALKPGGTFVLIGGSLPRIFLAMLLLPILSRTGSKKISFFIAKIDTRDLTYLKDLLEAGKIRSVIDRRYPLREAAEAVRYREEGHARGKVIVTVAEMPEAAGAAGHH